MRGGGGGGGGDYRVIEIGSFSGVQIKRSMSACIFRRHHSWSEVPPEILDLVLQSLPHRDCLNFGKVCASWRSVFLDRLRLSRPPPCLIQIPTEGLMPRHYLWCVHGDRLMKLFSPLPDLLPDPLHIQRIVGSTTGWLVINSRRGSSSKMFFLNATTNEQIPLPSVISGGLPIYPRLYDDEDSESCFVVIRINLSSPPTTSSCILLATVTSGGVRYLARCTPGDREWAILKLQPHQPVLLKESWDSVFHKGQLYILRLNGDLLLCTFDPQPKITILVSVVTLCSGENPFFKRLVISDGEVLLVVRRDFAMDGSQMPPVLWVFKSSERLGGWVRVESLGGRVLLIGLHGAESLYTNDLMGSTYEPNCIYYQPTRKFLEKYSMTDGINYNIHIPICGNYYRPYIVWVAAQAW